MLIDYGSKPPIPAFDNPKMHRMAALHLAPLVVVFVVLSDVVVLVLVGRWAFRRWAPKGRGGSAGGADPIPGWGGEG